MRMRRRLLLAVTGVLAASVVIMPAVAGSETSPKIEAVNYIETHYWSPSHASVSEGASVTLSNPTEVAHGVEWIAGPQTPACAGIPVGTHVSDSGKQWSGTCTFTQPGTYTFYCTVHHAEMTGVITVAANGTVTPGGPPSTPGSGSGTTGPSGAAGPGTPSPLGANAPGSPFNGASTRAVKLAPSQRGTAVRGTVNVSPAGAHGRLEVDLLAGSGALASAPHSRQVRLGRIVRSSLSAGLAHFSVPLNAKGKAALRRKGRLALSAKVLLKPANGSPVAVTRGVVLHH